jgi:hypothetical protein
MSVTFYQSLSLITNHLMNAICSVIVEWIAHISVLIDSSQISISQFDLIFIHPYHHHEFA